MASRDLTMGIFFLCKTVLGMLGNSALVCCFIIADFSGIKTRPIDPIIKYLTWANIVLIISRGIPQIMTAFGHTYFLDEIVCKLLYYLQTVTKEFFLGSTCLLSVIQVISISPSNSKFSQLKAKIPKIIGLSLVLCWSLCLFIHSLVIINVTDMRNKRNLTEYRQLLYCLAVNPSKHTYKVYVIILAASDVICLGLMMLTSGSMVLILVKHKQKFQHIHRSLTTRSSHETKAIQSIVILVSSFVVLFGTSFILMVYFSFEDGTDTCLLNVTVAMSAFFPVLCPFLLTRNYTRFFKPCST